MPRFDPCRVGLAVVRRSALTLGAVVALLGGASCLGAEPVREAVSLPAPAEWAAPAGAPEAPGGRFPLPPGLADAPGAEAPSIAEWNRAAGPDESLVLTGTRFTPVGKAPAVWAWARAADGKGGVLRRALVRAATDATLTATIPADLPAGMILLWVDSEAGASAPVCLNRAEPSWIGPLGDVVSPGETARVYGRSLTMRGRDGDPSTVCLRAAGGGAWRAVAVVEANPYAVAFRVPADLDAGAYEVWVHNGQGGDLGWGGPLSITVAAPWRRGDAEARLAPSGGDDTAAIRAAIDALTGLPAGGTVRLDAGAFTLSGQVDLKPGVRLLGAGMDATTLEVKWAGAHGEGAALVPLGAHGAIEDLTVRLWKTPTSPKRLLDGTGEPWDGLRLARLRVLGRPDAFEVDPERGVDQLLSLHGGRTEVLGCDFHRGLFGFVSDTWFHDNTFRGGPFIGHERGTEAGIYLFHHRRLTVDRNRFLNDWPVGPGGSRDYEEFLGGEALARRIWCRRAVFTQVDCDHAYLADNTVTDVAVGGGENKGEQFCWDNGTQRNPAWYGSARSSTPTTTTVRTDGLVGGREPRLMGMPAGREVPEDLTVETDPDNRYYAVVIGGAGVGQSRRVVGRTGDTLTVEPPWRVPPGADSVLIVGRQNRDQVVFRNKMSGFPAGYRFRHGSSASCPVSFYIHCWNCAAEGNESRRTYSATNVGGSAVWPSFWNVVVGARDLDVVRCGFLQYLWGTDLGPDLAGPPLLGNWFRGGEVTLLAVQPADLNGPPVLVGSEAAAPADGPPDLRGAAGFLGGFEGVRGAGGRAGVGCAPGDRMLYRRNALRGDANGERKWAEVEVDRQAHPILIDR